MSIVINGQYVNIVRLGHLLFSTVTIKMVSTASNRDKAQFPGYSGGDSSRRCCAVNVGNSYFKHPNLGRIGGDERRRCRVGIFQDYWRIARNPLPGETDRITVRIIRFACVKLDWSIPWKSQTLVDNQRDRGLIVASSDNSTF